MLFEKSSAKTLNNFWFGGLAPKPKIDGSFLHSFFSKKRVPPFTNDLDSLGTVSQLQCEKAGLYTIRDEGEFPPPLYHNLSKKAAGAGCCLSA